MSTPRDGQYGQYGQQGQYGQYGQPYPTYPAQPGLPVTPAPSKAMAIWALVLGWVPCLIGFVVSVVLAIIVLSRSKDGRDHGRTLAILGLVGVGCWVLLIGGLLVVRPFAAHRDSAGNVTKAGNVTIDQLRVGDCGQQNLSGYTRTVKVVPCREPHAFQVMATWEMTGGYPGDDAVKQQAESGCLARLRGIPALQGHPELHLSVLHPISSTWVFQKTVVCMVSSAAPTTGSLA